MVRRGFKKGTSAWEWEISETFFCEKNMTMISGEFMKYTGLMNKKIEKGILAYTERMPFRF